MKSILCVFSRILGGNTFSDFLESCIKKQGDVQADFVNYDSSIYVEQKPPFWLNQSCALQDSWRIERRCFAEVGSLEKYDLLLFQGYQLTLPFLPFIKDKTTVLALDTTPRQAIRHHLLALKHVPYTKKQAFLTRVLDTCCYKRIFRNINWFLARTELVKRSLIEDYGISEKKIKVTYLPVNNRASAPSGIECKLSLLFVGNDWVRKGGQFVLDVFDERMAAFANLTIVSKDKKVLGLPSVKGLTVVNGISNEELLSLMHQHDIFLFPSWKDELGLVLCEAVSQGLAILARKSGAQGEFVFNGRNGFLFEYNSTVEEWQEKLHYLCLNKQALYQLKENSLDIAQKKLNQNDFDKKLHSVIVDSK